MSGSSNEQVLNTGQQAITNYNTTKIFVGNNRFENGQYVNSSYDDVTLPGGRLMGRIKTSGKLVPHNSSATDGSQYPVGILNENHVVEAGDTAQVSICIAGDVVESQVVLYGSDLMSTVIDDKQIRDRIASDTVGIILVGGDELTDYDNQ